uniref:Uncharacterized protein n=1 Tax=Oryza punctata TaxID=4537 RepID=A0A0E0JNU2_ORYPU
MATTRHVCIVLCLVLAVVVAGAGLAATPAEARAVAEYAAPPGVDYDNVAGGAGAGGFGIRGRRRPGRWNVRSLQGGKREVPGGPDPQHHY